MSNNGQKSIMLNSLFSGKYISDSNSNNIGHEIINIYKADNGKNYIYVNPYGDFKDPKNYKVDTIIFVRVVSKTNYEIISIATGLSDDEARGFLPNGYVELSKLKVGKIKDELCNKLQPYFAETLNLKSTKEIFELAYSYIKNNNLKDDYLNKFKILYEGRLNQIKYIDEQEVTYGDVPLYKIFRYNEDDEIASYITFKPKQILVPNGLQIYISSDEKCAEFNTDKRKYYYVKPNSEQLIANEVMKGYYYGQDESNSQEGYLRLKEIIENNEGYFIETQFNTVDEVIAEIKDEEKQVANDNFLKIVKKENDEVIFSNLFEYFFSKYKKILCTFIDEVINVALRNMKNEGLKLINLSEDYTIKREWEKIDLLIEDENSIIVIENKILSNINGVKGKDIDGKLKSQLDKYYDLVNEKAKSSGKKAYFFLLHPKYNEIDLQRYKCGESYIKITYLEVYNCFLKINDEIKDNYFSDFVMVLKKHASDYDNTLREEMQRRFFKKIQEAKEQQ